MLVDGDVSKLKTADCRQWLATSDEIQNLVKDRYGWLDDEKTLLESKMRLITSTILSPKQPSQKIGNDKENLSLALRPIKMNVVTAIYFRAREWFANSTFEIQK
jgi:hypothetical protein